MKKTLCALLCTLLLTGCTTSTDMTTATDMPQATAVPTQSATSVPGLTDGTMPDTMPGTMPGTGTDGMGGTDGAGVLDSMMPGSSTAPDATDMPDSTGVTSIDKVGRVIEQIEDELERLSEVDDAQVIIAGDRAAVALEFDDQYRGGIDDRLRGIVKERIDSVISGISTIAITADEAVMDAIERLGEGISTASDMEQLRRDVDAVISKIDPAA